MTLATREVGPGVYLVYLSHDTTYIRSSQQRCSGMEIIIFYSRDMKGDKNTVTAFVIPFLLVYTQIGLNLFHRF